MHLCTYCCMTLFLRVTGYRFHFGRGSLCVCLRLQQPCCASVFGNCRPNHNSSSCHQYIAFRTRAKALKSSLFCFSLSFSPFVFLLVLPLTSVQLSSFFFRGMLLLIFPWGLFRFRDGYFVVPLGTGGLSFAHKSRAPPNVTAYTTTNFAPSREDPPHLNLTECKQIGTDRQRHLQFRGRL